MSFELGMHILFSLKPFCFGGRIMGVLINSSDSPPSFLVLSFVPVAVAVPPLVGLAGLLASRSSSGPL